MSDPLDPSKRDFYFGCPKCVEPETELKHGKHIFLNVTTTNFGADCSVLIHCIVCGTIKDITKNIFQIPSDKFKELLKKGRKENE